MAPAREYVISRSRAPALIFHSHDIMPVKYRAQEIREFLTRLDGAPADSLENQWLEFKEVPKDRRTGRVSIDELKKVLIEAAVCFANAEGGTVVIGVNDKAVGYANACRGVDKSINIDSLQRSVMDSTDPKVFPTFEWFEIDSLSDPLLLMFIEQSSMPPCSYNGRIHFRHDKNCILLSGSLIRSLFFPDTSPKSSQEFVSQVIEKLLDIVRVRDDSPEANTAVTALAKFGEAAVNDLIEQWLSNYGDNGDNDTLTRIQNTWVKMKDEQEVAEYVISCLNGESEDRRPPGFHRGSSGHCS